MLIRCVYSNSIVITIFTFFLTGYGLSFGKSNGFCGTEFFALVGLPEDRMAHCFFMFSFAATAATIPSGVVHERCSIIAYVYYTALIGGSSLTFFIPNSNV
jgi:Amt family ammonium transporter